jgi:DnaJ-class molecular chaperone
MLVSPQEVMVVVGSIAFVLLFVTKLGLLKRSCNRFMSEFRQALHGTDEEAPDGKDSAQHHVEADDICYQLLGITPSATPEEIREAYRRKAKQYHPDKGGDPDMMRALTEAYRKLSKRR